MTTTGDIRCALADMATQIRTCRNYDGLTLQQLAARSHVAASTIHKIEAQQMIPTISVLLKIAKGLERRPLGADPRHIDEQGGPPDDVARDHLEQDRFGGR